MEYLSKAWKWADGKKTTFAGLGFMLFGALGLALHLLEKEQAIQHILTGAALLGLGGKANKILEALKKRK